MGGEIRPRFVPQKVAVAARIQIKRTTGDVILEQTVQMRPRRRSSLATWDFPPAIVLLGATALSINSAAYPSEHHLTACA
jgi:hypothetical protein